MRQVKEDGKMGDEPYLEGTRVRVSDIAVKFEKLGYSVDEILQAYPRLERSDVHTALSYFYDNEEDISASIDVEEAGAAV
ncbi:MAG: DUF433 domain-containing protein [Candidatus Nanosalina sp.]